MFEIKAIFAFLRSPIARYIGIALVLAGILWGVYMAIGSRFTAACENKHAVALAASIKRAAAEARQIALQDAEIVNWVDTRTTTVYETLWREHETTVYADCSLTPAQRVLHNRAIRAATDISDSSLEAGPSEGLVNSGGGDVGGDEREQHQEYEAGAPTGDRPGSGQENVGSAWVVGGGY